MEIDDVKRQLEDLRSAARAMLRASELGVSEQEGIARVQRLADLVGVGYQRGEKAAPIPRDDLERAASECGRLFPSRGGGGGAPQERLARSALPFRRAAAGGRAGARGLRLDRPRRDAPRDRSVDPLAPRGAEGEGEGLMRAIEQLIAEGRPSARRRRDPRVFDATGTEVLITLTCPHCGKTKPLREFGLRKMGNGAIRNCPWCKACRANPGAKIELVVRPA